MPRKPRGPEKLPKQVGAGGAGPAGAGASVTSPAARLCLGLRGGPEPFWGLGDPLHWWGGEKCLQPTRVRLCSQFPPAAWGSTKELGVHEAAAHSREWTPELLSGAA